MRLLLPVRMQTPRQGFAMAYLQNADHRLGGPRDIRSWLEFGSSNPLSDSPQRTR